MKKILSFMAIVFMAVSMSACGNDDPVPDMPDSEESETEKPAENSDVLVACFSLGGTTLRMASQIADATGGTLFEIEPVNPYPAEYTPCTEVALRERDTDARPEIKNKVPGWDKYKVVFIGCPVWWHTAPMIINTFVESYDFSGKTVIPFCTYASTYRDETLQRIVELTPHCRHLAGLGLTSSALGNTDRVDAWLRELGFLN